MKISIQNVARPIVQGPCITRGSLHGNVLNGWGGGSEGRQIASNILPIGIAMRCSSSCMCKSTPPNAPLAPPIGPGIVPTALFRQECLLAPQRETEKERETSQVLLYSVVCCSSSLVWFPLVAGATKEVNIQHRHQKRAIGGHARLSFVTEILFHLSTSLSFLPPDYSGAACACHLLANVLHLRCMYGKWGYVNLFISRYCSIKLKWKHFHEGKNIVLYNNII